MDDWNESFRQAIESALTQAGVTTEVIVVDDASTDHTRAVVEAFGDSVRLVSLPKQSTSIATTNAGVGSRLACASASHRLGFFRNRQMRFVDAAHMWEAFMPALEISQSMLVNRGLSALAASGGALAAIDDTPAAPALSDIVGSFKGIVASATVAVTDPGLIGIIAAFTSPLDLATFFINAKYAELGGAGGFLGTTTSAVRTIARRVGRHSIPSRKRRCPCPSSRTAMRSMRSSMGCSRSFPRGWACSSYAGDRTRGAPLRSTNR